MFAYIKIMQRGPSQLSRPTSVSGSEDIYPAPPINFAESMNNMPVEGKAKDSNTSAGEQLVEQLCHRQRN